MTHYYTLRQTRELIYYNVRQSCSLLFKVMNYHLQFVIVYFTVCMLLSYMGFLNYLEFIQPLNKSSEPKNYSA